MSEATSRKTSSDAEPADSVHAPRPLTAKQRRFAALVAAGMDRPSAYRASYRVGDESKPESIARQARALARNSRIAVEIIRVRAGLARPEAKSALRAMALDDAAAHAGVAEQPPTIPDLDGLERYSREWILAMLDSTLARAMEVRPKLNRAGRPTGSYTFDGDTAIKTLELMASIQGFIGERAGAAPTLEDLPLEEVRRRRAELGASLDADQAR